MTPRCYEVLKNTKKEENTSFASAKGQPGTRSTGVLSHYSQTLNTSSAQSHLEISKQAEDPNFEKLMSCLEVPQQDN